MCGHEGQLIIEELFNEEASAGAEVEALVHDDNNYPATPEVLNRRQSRYLSEMQVVFARLMLLQKQKWRAHNRNTIATYICFKKDYILKFYSELTKNGSS